MSRHLPILMAKFPGKVVLNVEDIASLTEYSKGHIYNLSSAEKLPFRIGNQLGDRILVSIVEMSDYLDSALLSGPIPSADQAHPSKRKVGRPRGTTKASLKVQLFQSQLRTAILTVEGQEILMQALRYVEEMSIPSRVDGEYAKEFGLAKLVIQAQIKALRTRFSNVSVSIRASDFDRPTSAEITSEPSPFTP